jgi:hypothetical protein
MTAARGGMISSNELLCCNFNQDATYVLRSTFYVVVVIVVLVLMMIEIRCISIGSLSGYSIINCDPFGKVYHGVTSAWRYYEL